MSQLQRIYANESGPWNATTGTKNMSWTIDSQAAANLARSFIILRTTLDVGANPTKACVRQISVGYQQMLDVRYPVGIPSNSFLRDVQLTSEKQGSLVAAQYNNVLQAGLRPFTVSEAEQRVRASAGEGWQDMGVYAGNAGVSGTGNYQSAWTNTVRDGAVAPATPYVPYIDMIVPVSELLGGIGRVRNLPLASLGRCTLSCAVEQGQVLATAYARDAASAWPAFTYTYTDATHIVVDVLPRDLDGDCPFYIGQGFRTSTAVDLNITEIAINGGGQISLTVDADATGNGTMRERTLDAAETCTWSISEASLILATSPAPKLTKSFSVPYLTFVDIPWGPPAAAQIANTFTLPAGCVAVFFIAPLLAGGGSVFTSSIGNMTRARFSLDGVDLTNRDLMLAAPSSALYKDRLIAALNASQMSIGSFVDDTFCAIPAASWQQPTGAASQLQLSISNSAAFPAGVTHLFCAVIRTMNLH